MSSLSFSERRLLEDYFGMSSGYVLDFSDSTFGEFVGEAVEVDIHSEKYQTEGSSKAKKLRAFWKRPRPEGCGNCRSLWLVC